MRIDMIEVVKNVAAVVGCALSCISLLTLVCKPIRKAVIGFITSKSGRTEMEQQIGTIKEMLEAHLEADREKQIRAAADREALLCLLRNSVTRIYYAYLPNKAIPAHEYKNMIFLSEAYENLGGNSYVTTIVANMKEWETLPD